jgi:hypothetical protein
LYAIKNTTLVQFGLSTGWSDVCGDYSGAFRRYGYGINNGCIYRLYDTTATKLTRDSGWTKIFGRCDVVDFVVCAKLDEHSYKLSADEVGGKWLLQEYAEAEYVDIAESYEPASGTNPWDCTWYNNVIVIDVISHSGWTGIPITEFLTIGILNDRLNNYSTTSEMESAISTALSDYVTSTSLATTLGDYVTETDLSTALSDYVTSTSLATTLGDYVTTTTLGDYVTETDLSTALGDYVTETYLSTALGDYVTSTSLSTTLGDYVTSTSLATTLGDYVTTTTLGDYVTSTSLATTLGDYVTTTTLGDYVTETDLSTALGDYVTSTTLSSYTNTTDMNTAISTAVTAPLTIVNEATTTCTLTPGKLYTWSLDGVTGTLTSSGFSVTGFEYGYLEVTLANAATITVNPAITQTNAFVDDSVNFCVIRNVAGVLRLTVVDTY